jgi:outer membrane protein
MNRRISFAVGLVLSSIVTPWAGRISADDSARLDVEQCVSTALERNRDVLRARERLAKLDGQIQEVKSQVYPRIGFDAGYTRSYDESFLDTFEGFIQPREVDTYTVTTTLNQLLFSWGRASTAVEIARVSRIQAEYDLGAVERDVKLRVHEAFYRLLLAQRLVEVAAETLAQRERHLDVAAKRYEAGVVNEFEVIRARVDVANARAPLIRARNQVRQAKAGLNNLLARDQGAPIEAAGHLEYVALVGLTLEQTVEQALSRRPELASLRAARDIAEKNLSIARAEDKPTANMQAQYGFATENVENLNPNRERWSAGVVVSLPLFDGWRTRGLVAQASSQVRDVDLATKQLQESITLEAKVSLDDLGEAQEIIEASSLNIEQAEQALRLAEISYQYGVATTLDVTDAELALTVARTNHAQALHDYMLAKARLLSVMNSL